MTDGTELPKLRKQLRWSDFLKFTLFERMSFDSYTSIVCSSKLQIFAFGFAKQMTDVSQARKVKPG